MVCFDIEYCGQSSLLSSKVLYQEKGNEHTDQRLEFCIKRLKLCGLSFAERSCIDKVYDIIGTIRKISWVSLLPSHARDRKRRMQ